MTPAFTPQLEIGVMFAAIAIFGLTAYFTRATHHRVTAALIATLAISALNILWDIAAHIEHWWWYPSIDRRFAPLPIYLAQDLVWGGAFGLIGWRVQRRFGTQGQLIFVVLLTGIGAIRDSVSAGVTGLIVFGEGITPLLADLACWATLLVVAQTTMRLLGRLAPKHERTRSP